MGAQVCTPLGWKHRMSHAPSHVPRFLPRFYLAAVEKNSKVSDTFLHGCEIKSGRRPGNEALTPLGWVHRRESSPLVGCTGVSLT